MNDYDYILSSLELHLFFDRIMKEHSLFLELGFTEKDNNWKKIAKDFQKVFSDILMRVIELADGNISNSLLASSEIVTKNTVDAEVRTSNLSGDFIDIDITKRELQLKSGRLVVDKEILNSISNINKQTLPIIENLINFKNNILNGVLACYVYTTNYPLLINHIMNEAKMYHNLLGKVEARKLFTEKELYEQELFWDTIMKEHAEFIRGLLDPSEQELIVTADKYAKEYKEIIDRYNNNPNYLTNVSLNETINFRNFKVVGEEGILNCKIKSVIVPLLADHVVREANHFIRVLKELKTN